MPKILIVEDNELNRDMLSRRLERKGYQICMAVDGREGVEKAESEAPDIMLLDMGLPIMDGWEVARAIRSSEKMRRLPIIAITAHAMDGDRERALEAGCDEYDTKPIELPGLLEKIERLLKAATPPVA